MKWLVVSSHDERYDFNLELKIFNGTLEEFEKSFDGSFYTKEDKSKYKDGVYVYHTERRSNKNCPNLDEKVWDKVKENFEVVNFSTTILVPFEYLNDEDFFVRDSLASRNVKFGFLDIINKNN